jgi:hypothetical protein
LSVRRCPRDEADFESAGVDVQRAGVLVADAAVGEGLFAILTTSSRLPRLRLCVTHVEIWPTKKSAASAWMWRLLAAPPTAVLRARVRYGPSMLIGRSPVLDVRVRSPAGGAELKPAVTPTPAPP